MVCELKSVIILIKMGFYFRHSVDIISTSYVYENRRKWFHLRTGENVAASSKFDFIFILFF